VLHKEFHHGGYRRVNSGSEKGTGLRMEDGECLLDDDKESECLLNDDNETLMQQSSENAVATKHERGWKFCQESLAAYLDAKDNLVAEKLKLLKDNNENNNEAIDRTSLYLAMTHPKTDDVTSPQELGTDKLRRDDRISEEQLHTTVYKDNQFATEQEKDLYNVLAKYGQHLTK